MNFQKVCEVCGKDFIAGSGIAKYCKDCSKDMKNKHTTLWQQKISKKEKYV